MIERSSTDISCAGGILLLLSRPNVLPPPGGGIAWCQCPTQITNIPLLTQIHRCIVSVLRHEFLWRVKFVPGFVPSNV